ncbi:hydrolase of the alpha/beta fold superfamily protein, partial [mine drainage metagenome]
LSSSSLRRAALRRRAQLVAQVTRAEVLHLDAGVRLQGFHSVQQALPQRHGLVLLLHGWEGSADSNYMQATSACLLRAGYDVYRLNFRDHGDSHALNVEPFHSCRLDEVAAAAAQVCARPGAGLRAIAGFSLGGNFALRVARAAPARGIALDYALAVCPVIDPAHGLRQLERGWLYHAYFMRKWRGSLRRKQTLFPELPVLRRGDRRLNMRELTRALVQRYTPFGSLEAYLDGYSVAGDRLARMQVPATILTAADDPVIPVADFRALRLPDCVELDIAPHGGHCAFLTGAGLRSFVGDYLLARLDARAPTPRV